MSEGMSTAPTHALESELELSATSGAGSMGNAASSLSLEDAFDVPRTAELILTGGYKTIGLQFPDDLLPSSVAVYRALQKKIAGSGAQAYVLADSTYGACCPDVLSCLHLPADLLVHYGHACLTPTDALPVHYVFPRFSLDPAAAFEELNSKTDWRGKAGAIVVWDVAYDWLADDIGKAFSKLDKPVSFAPINRPEIGKAPESAAASACCKPEPASSCCKDAKEPTPTASGCCKETPAAPSACCKEEAPAASSCCAPASAPQSSCCGSSKPAAAPSACCSSTTAPVRAPSTGAKAMRTIAPPPGVALSDCALWYLGSDGRSLLNIQMTHSSVDMYAYDPEAGARECTGASRLLSRRLFAVHLALDADVFGLVVGNIGLASSRPLLSQLRTQLAAKGKKSYTLSVGRLNPAKLANFADIECFVLVGCAEGGIVDSKEFIRPIITPYELTLALTGAEWDPSSWTLDLARVLDSVSAETTTAAEDKPADSDDDDKDREFSLITGTYRTRRVFAAGGPSTGAASAATEETGTSQDLVARGDFSVAKLESAGSMFLESRSFKGLEPRYGLDEPSLLEQGRSGIARGYTEEK